MRLKAARAATRRPFGPATRNALHIARRRVGPAQDPERPEFQCPQARLADAYRGIFDAAAAALSSDGLAHDLGSTAICNGCRASLAAIRKSWSKVDGRKVEECGKKPTWTWASHEAALVRFVATGLSCCCG
jgi:hypothetical protein